MNTVNNQIVIDMNEKDEESHFSEISQEENLQVQSNDSSCQQIL